MMDLNKSYKSMAVVDNFEMMTKLTLNKCMVQNFKITTGLDIITQLQT